MYPKSKQRGQSVGTVAWVDNEVLYSTRFYALMNYSDTRPCNNKR